MSPLRAARERAAIVFDTVLRDMWDAGDNSVSNVALAERWLGVSEKTVRKWRSAEHAHDKPIPLAALFALPDAVTIRLLERAMNDRLGRFSDPLVVARRALTDAVRAGLTDAQRSELAAILFGGSR